MSTEAHIKDTESQGISTFYYTVAGYNILLESAVKTEIIEKRSIFPVPHTPDWCHGMISLRGKLIPVANLHRLLNASEPENSPWLLVLEKAPFPPLAIHIDQLPMQLLINDTLQKKVDQAAFPHWIRTSTTIGDKVFHGVSHTELFEQLIQENEKTYTSLDDKPNTPNQDSSGSDV